MDRQKRFHLHYCCICVTKLRCYQGGCTAWSWEVSGDEEPDITKQADEVTWFLHGRWRCQLCQFLAAYDPLEEANRIGLADEIEATRSFLAERGYMGLDEPYVQPHRGRRRTRAKGKREEDGLGRTQPAQFAASAESSARIPSQIPD